MFYSTVISHACRHLDKSSIVALVESAGEVEISFSVWIESGCLGNLASAFVHQHVAVYLKRVSGVDDIDSYFAGFICDLWIQL